MGIAPARRRRPDARPRGRNPRVVRQSWSNIGTTSLRVAMRSPSAFSRAENCNGTAVSNVLADCYTTFRAHRPCHNRCRTAQAWIADNWRVYIEYT